MVVSRGPVGSTGPTQKSQNSTQAVRDRLETIENNIKRLAANRNPQTFQLHQLSNTKPMSQVADQQFVMYDKASGQYVPSFVDKMQNEYAGASSYIEITNSNQINIVAEQSITIQSGGCGPMIIEAPEVEINTSLLVNFTATFEEEVTVNAPLQVFSTSVALPDLPTSSSGLPSGRLWRSGTTVMIV